MSGRTYVLHEEIDRWLADFDQRREVTSGHTLTETYPRLLGRASVLLEQARAMLEPQGGKE